jgi:putative membrane protein
MSVSRLLPLLLMPLGLFSCSSGESNKDPVAEAKFKNEKRIGDEAITEKQEQDAEYVVNTASRNMFVRDASQLAQTKSASAAVKTLAQTLVAQHAIAQQTLQTLAAQKNIVLPTGLGGDQAKTLGQLAGLNGAAFDQKYTDILIEAHKKAVDETDDMRDEAYDGDIRQLATQQLPLLKQHLEAAEALEDQLKK